MDRRRAAGFLLALAASIAIATAAPTASNHTALDLYDGAPDGCYYNFQHYGEGDRIMTNEPCLNCTCHNRMLMCYLRVCPFTKPIGQDCTIEKRADQCCPIVTCPDVPVDLLTSTTTSPAEYGPTGVGKLDKFGCSLNGKYFSEGSKVPPTPNKPCEHCYCIRNMTTCVMQECTLHVDGCTPIYHKDVCCPVRYSCDHPEDEMPLLDDLSTTVRPTPGFLLTTTTVSPVTQISQDCVYDSRIFPDGALIKTEKACDHCYCMKGDIVCVVQECGTPMENEGKNCTALAPRDGVCCPDTYICEGDEPSTGSYETDDFTTHASHDELTTLSPPRRTISEGSGYRNEPDEVPYTKLPILPEIEGSGEEEEPKPPTEILPGSSTVGTTEDILGSTEETHEYIPLTTSKPVEIEITTTGHDESTVSGIDKEKTYESQQNLPTTTDTYSINNSEDSTTDRNQEGEIGSGETSEDVSHKPYEDASVTPGLVDIIATTEINKQNVVTSPSTERESSESEKPVTSIPTVEDIKTNAPSEQDTITGNMMEKSTPKLPIEHAFTNAPISEDSTKIFEVTEQSYVTEESTTKGSETHDSETTSMSIIENELKETTNSAEQNVVTIMPDENPETPEDNLTPQRYPQSTNVPDLEEEFVTTESPGHELGTEGIKKPGYFKPQQHVTASTPMLEEIEKDTTEYTEPERIVPSIATQDDSSQILSTTISNILSLENDEKDVSKTTITEEHTTEDHIIGTTSIPVYDQQEITSEEPHNISDVQTNIDESSDSSMSSTPNVEESGRRTTQPDFTITYSQDDSSITNLSPSTTAAGLEIEGVTAEPDKDLNTIPSDTIEEAPISPEVHKSTLPEEIITTETNLDLLTTTSQQTTVAYTSISREESSALTTESAFRKDDYSPTGSYHKLTTVTAGITNEVIPTVTLDQTKITELEPQGIAITTTGPIYTENIEETTLAKESTSAPSYEESSTPKVSESVEESMTSAPTYETLPVTTAVNQEDNEILNEPRIPGEGDCLLNGETYRNESAVPSSNKCQSGCKCISSIIKCDPIICSPAPEYMNNCETMYDSPDACCPTYICDHKSETMPPQSHSQMSGTEAPVILTKPCHGDECQKEDKKHSEESPETCKSGSCAGSSNETKVTSVPLIENIPHQPVTDQKEECVGDSCKPILCTVENGCQATPVKPCEGNKCETAPNTIISPEPPQQCVDGESCADSNIASEDCTSGNCDATHVQSEDTHLKETCTDKDGCQVTSSSSEQECKEENCKEKESHPLDQHLPEQCSGPGCKKTQTDIETEQSESVTKEKPVKVTEPTEKLETITEPSKQTHSDQASEVFESHEIVTKYPEIILDGLTTLSDKIDEITQFESQTETSTKSTEFINQHEVTSGEYVPDKTLQETPEEQDQLLPVATESTVKENENKITSSDEIFTEVPNVFISSQDDANHATEKEHPQIVTEATAILESNDQAETSTKISGESQTQKSESVQTLEAENTTPLVLQENFSEPPKTDTPEYQKVSSEVEYEKTTVKIVEESGTEPTHTEEGTILPGIAHEDATIMPEQESSTEPARTYGTESQEDITKKIEEESVTTPPKSLGDIEHDSIIGMKRPTTVTEDQTEKIDKVETASKPSLDRSSTLGNVELDVTTIKITDSIESEPTEVTSTESEDVSQPPKEKYTTSIPTKETTTDSINAHITEFFETTVSSITKLPQESNENDFTGTDIEESGTVPTRTSDTETKEVTESSENAEPEFTTIKVSAESSTESAQTYVTEPKSPEQVYHDDTTAKSVAESSTEPTNLFPMDERESTKSPEGIDQELITDISQDYYTEPPNVSEFTEEIEGQTDTTSKIFDESSTEVPKTYSPEPEVIKSSDEDVNTYTTLNILGESITEPSKAVEIKPQEVPKPPVDQEETTHSVTTELSEPYATEAEEIQSSRTTSKASYDITTETSKTTEEIKHQVDFKPTEQFNTENDIKFGTTNPTIVEIPSRAESEMDSKKPSMELEISQDTTSSQDLYTSEPTLSSEDEKQVDTTSDTAYDITSLPPKTDIDHITDSPVNNQLSTLSIPTKQDDHDHSTSVIPGTSRPEPGETTLTQQESETPGIETQTVSSSTVGLEASQSETTSTQLPEKSTATEKVPEQMDTEIQGSPYTPADELRTTSFEMQDFTTSKPIRTSQSPHDMEIMTEHSETSHTFQEEPHTEKLTTVMLEVSTEETSLGTENPVEIQEEIKTEKLETVSEGIPTETEMSQTSSDKKPSINEESYTEEPVSKYSLSESTVELDSTKSYPNENIATTESVLHESKETTKPVYDLTQSLVTEKSEISTKPSDSDSLTQKPIQVSTGMPESDITQLSEQDGLKNELTTPSSKSSDTTISHSDDQTESVTATDFAKPIIVEEIRTELPQLVDNIENEVTTHKESLPEDVTTPESEIIMSTTLEHKLTTERLDMTALELTTETIAPVTLISETQESVGTNGPLLDVHNLQTEAPFTTMQPGTKVTKEQDKPLSISDHTESELEVIDEVTDIQVHEQTEPPKIRPEESPIASSSTESPTSEPVKEVQSVPPVEEDSIAVDQVTTKVPETSSKEQPELSTFKPSGQDEVSSEFESTTAAIHEYPESTNMALEDSAYTNKIKEVTPIGEQFTTENIGVTESSDLLSPEVNSETQPEILQTITPQKEPEVYQTTLSTIEILPGQSTNVPTKSEEESTTSAHDVVPAAEQTLPVEEQSIPVVISNTEKTSSPEESVSMETSTSEKPPSPEESVLMETSTSDKPSQETTASEEHILETQKPTVVPQQVEEEISSGSPISDRPAEPTDLRTETPLTTASELAVTRTPETFVTITPESSAPEASDTPTAEEFEASVTPVSEAHFTASTEASASIASKLPDKPASEAHTTAESDVTTTTTTASEALATKAPEVPIKPASDTPATAGTESPISVESEAPVTEASEVPVTAASEATVTREAEAAITIASEQSITPASEAPVTPAQETSEVPITTAPESPKPVSTEAQPVDDVPPVDEEASFPPSAGVSGYGPEPSDYGEEDQNFGPGTCRYGGKVYVSAQQIPRDDPCDFCFCFRSDIICLQQSCPPPIHGCHEEPIQGFCCPRYECPVSMATTVNVTTTTTTTTTTLPPHFPTHSYKGSAQKRGCQIKGQTYKVGDIVRASSGPCLHCTCGGDGQMKCDPKVCTPEPMLRQMIAAAVSAKRRR